MRSWLVCGSVLSVAIGCKYNAEISIRPQFLASLEALSACPNAGAQFDLDLLVVSSLDRQVEAGHRISRAATDNCTVGADSDDADACALSIAFGDATIYSEGTVDEGMAVGLDPGELVYCDANAHCGSAAGQGSPLHLALVFDHGEEVATLDPDQQRLDATKNMIDPLLCAGRSELFPGCPFSEADEVRFWTLSAGQLREEGSWVGDLDAARSHIESIETRVPTGDGPIFDGLAEVAEAVSARGEAGDGRAIVLITTDGNDRVSSMEAQDVSGAIPIHVISLATASSIEEDLQEVACASGGSYRALVDPSDYDVALQRIRYALRGRWRSQVAISGIPKEIARYSIATSATLEVENGEPLPNPTLRFQVQP